MKKTMILLVFSFIFSCLLFAEDPETIALPAPDFSNASSLYQAFKDRKSTRNFLDKDISLQMLSSLLWAANGVNRPETGHRTAPSAMNARDIDLYVCFSSAVYLYLPVEHRLQKVGEGDCRPAVADQQNFVATAPLSLVLVSDLSRFGEGNLQENMITGAYDAGIVAQNVNIFCAAMGLATVVRGSMDKEALRELLKLSPSQHPMLNLPVGYAAD